NGSGVAQWTADGVAQCTASGTQQLPALTSDGASGAIVAWYDDRTFNFDVYAQRVNSAGAVQWTVDGVAICTAAEGAALPLLNYGPAIVSDGGTGAIIGWYDTRGGGATKGDIYAQRVNSAGATQWTANGVTVCSAADYQLDPV